MTKWLLREDHHIGAHYLVAGTVVGEGTSYEVEYVTTSMSPLDDEALTISQEYFATLTPGGPSWRNPPTEVYPMPATIPVNVDVPHVSGAGTVDSVLTCTMGNWTGEPTSYGYEWVNDSGTVLGSGSTYTVVYTDVMSSISCVVTATNGAGSTVAPPSNAVTIAEAATQAAGPASRTRGGR
jgi:hypothetical protein